MRASELIALLQHHIENHYDEEIHLRYRFENPDDELESTITDMVIDSPRGGSYFAFLVGEQKSFGKYE
jgi:hypothetical protein